MGDQSNRDGQKRLAAAAALEHVPRNEVVGVGTGSTADHFIDLLATRGDCPGAVASSEASARRLAQHGIRLLDLNQAGPLAVYVDGADEADAQLRLIKGGGGALTREKIIAAASERFICIADESKLVERLGAFPLPVEVLPLARTLVAAHLDELGGRPSLRQGFLTDNGNEILDVHGLTIEDPEELECRINDIPGTVTNGLFALRPADLLLLGAADGVRSIARSG